MNTHDTILAIASSPGRSGRGILRLSGTAAFDLLAKVLECDGDLPATGSRCLRLHLSRFELPCLVLFFRGPNSYTGEDSAELQCAGNPLLLERITETMLDEAKRHRLDLRRAEAGEFTARAFLNGKMNLIEAEGVAATIAAQSDAELRAAKMLNSGELSNLAHGLADELAEALALVEAGIDFTDQEDVVAIAPDDLARRLNVLRDRIAHQLRRAVGMEQFEEIPWVVFCGPPNAGKSTLFNALLGRERAVVSHIEGTTRDVLVEPLTIETFHGTAEVMLVDLAGADVEDTILHRRMQTVASEALRRAELILHCVPAGEVKPDVRGREIVVVTKADLLKGIKPYGLVVSAKDGRGLDTLRQLITDRLVDRAVSLDADLMVMQARHESALRAAHSHLEEAVICIAPEVEQRHLSMPELVASSMRAALNELAALAGDITPDEVLGRVFASFCVGK